MESDEVKKDPGASSSPSALVSAVPNGCEPIGILKLPRLRVFTLLHGNPFIKLLMLQEVPVV